jgi:hypothetical protein
VPCRRKKIRRHFVDLFITVTLKKFNLAVENERPVNETAEAEKKVKPNNKS